MTGVRSPAVSVVVCTTRNPDRLRQTLDALPSGAEGVAYELVLVLNGADRDVAAVARAEEAAGAGVVVVESGENLGFAGGTNLGVAAAHAPLLLLLHDDAVLEPGALRALVEAASRHPEAGVVGPLILGPSGLIKHAGAIMFADGVSASPHAGADPRGVTLEARTTDYCGSCCALVRAELWRACGGLDERFFPSGYIDADLAFTARRLGWTVRYEPGARARHADGSLSHGFKEWCLLRNRERFLAKWREDLAELEPRDGSPEALSRAVAGAARRQPAPAGSRTPPPRPETGSSTRERELELLRAYVAEVDREVVARREEVVARDELLAARGQELASLHTYVEGLARDLDSLNRAAAVDAAEITRLHAVIAELQGR